MPDTFKVADIHLNNYYISELAKDLQWSMPEAEISEDGAEVSTLADAEIFESQKRYVLEKFKEHIASFALPTISRVEQSELQQQQSLISEGMAQVASSVATNVGNSVQVEVE